MSSLGQVHSRPWLPAVAALVAVTVALGVALVVPSTFSDPNGVDPDMLRLSLTALLLLGVCCVASSTVAARGVLIAVAAATVSFSALSGLPQVMVDIFSNAAPSADWQVWWASLAQVVLTFVIAAVALVVIPAHQRPSLRLRRFGVAALVASLLGTAVLVGLVMLLPATWLGRLALQPVAIARDLPLLGPANALQGLAQEVQFRGLLMGSLERFMPPAAANVLQACFFGLAHLAVNYEGPVGPFVPVTIAVGLLLGWMAQRSRSLWPAIIVHAVADVLIVVGVMPGLYAY